MTVSSRPPPPVKNLIATIDRKSSTLNLNNGDSGTIWLVIKDQFGISVPGANVTFSVQPADGISATVWKKANNTGIMHIPFTTSKPGNYSITITPVKTVNYTGVYSDSVIVIVSSTTFTPSKYQMIGIAAVIISITIASILFTVFYISRKKRKPAVNLQEPYYPPGEQPPN